MADMLRSRRSANIVNIHSVSQSLVMFIICQQMVQLKFGLFHACLRDPFSKYDIGYSSYLNTTLSSAFCCTEQDFCIECDLNS
jgi:hypothetical protein